MPKLLPIVILVAISHLATRLLKLTHKCHAGSAGQAVQGQGHAVDVEEVQGDEPVDGGQLGHVYVVPH